MHSARLTVARYPATVAESVEREGGGPSFVPFRAWRYAPDLPLAQVLAPPYDVLSDVDVAALRASSPHNIVHVDVPAPGADGTDRYAVAARTLAGWQERGVLVRDPVASLTIYRMSFHDGAGRARSLVGVLGGLEVVDPGVGRVLPHERTTPKASTDRLDLTRATRANLSPVWGLALGRGLTELLASAGEPLGALEVDGVEHAVERIVDPERIAAIAAVIGADDVLIADGHHRYGVARSYRDEVVTGASGASPVAAAGAQAARHTLAFVGALVADQLAVDAIHRLVSGLGSAALREALGRDFALVPGPSRLGPAVTAELHDRGALLLVEPAEGGAGDAVETSWLMPRAGAFDGVRALDGAWLEQTLAGSGAILDYQHGVGEVLAALHGGRAEAAILIRPTSLGEIERTAREGLLMPPKSTFFTPKLRTGLVVRDLRTPD